MQPQHKLQPAVLLYQTADFVLSECMGYVVCRLVLVGDISALV